MEGVTLTISILTVVVSFVMFVVFDRKLKSQQLQINDYVLKRQMEEEADSKRACITAFGRGEDHGAYFTVQNTGKAVARNVRFSLDPKLDVGLNPFPLDVMWPGDSVRVTVLLCLSDLVSTKCTFAWEDASGERPSSYVLSFS